MSDSTMSNMFNDIIEQKMLHVHTAFLGKIISFNSTKHIATVQPLTLQKQYGKSAKKQSVLTDIPVAHTAQFKFTWEYIDDWIDGNQGCADGHCTCHPQKRRHVKMQWISPGDICICVVCERDITAARRGESDIPALGHHEIKDAVVVGTLDLSAPDYPREVWGIEPPFEM